MIAFAILGFSATHRTFIPRRHAPAMCCQVDVVDLLAEAQQVIMEYL